MVQAKLIGFQSRDAQEFQPEGEILLQICRRWRAGK